MERKLSGSVLNMNKSITHSMTEKYNRYLYASVIEWFYALNNSKYSALIKLALKKLCRFRETKLSQVSAKRIDRVLFTCMEHVTE